MYEPIGNPGVCGQIAFLQMQRRHQQGQEHLNPGAFHHGEIRGGGRLFLSMNKKSFQAIGGEPDICREVRGGKEGRGRNLLLDGAGMKTCHGKGENQKKNLIFGKTAVAVNQARKDDRAVSGGQSLPCQCGGVRI